MPVDNDRRRFLGGIGSMALASAAGYRGFGRQDTESLAAQLERVASATERYEDPRKALEDGFKIGGPYVPGMGWHFTHPERLRTAAKQGFDIEKPPMLTYLDNDQTDGLRLAAVEYGLPAQIIKERGTPDLFNDENADATEEWHTHEAATHVFATPDGERNDPENVPFETWTNKLNWAEFRPLRTDLEPGDTISLNWGHVDAKTGVHKESRVVDLVSNHPSLTTLHAWVHVDNPAGVFKPVNSKYAGEHH